MSEEKEIREKPKSLDDLFGGETVVAAEIKGVKVRFYLRELDSETDLDYQRRLSRTKNNNGKVELTDAALQADAWLFGKLCTRVVASIDGRDEETAGFEKIAPDLKRAVLQKYRQRLDTAGDLGN